MILSFLLCGFTLIVLSFHLLISLLWLLFGLFQAAAQQLNLMADWPVQVEFYFRVLRHV